MNPTSGDHVHEGARVMNKPNCGNAATTHFEQEEENR